MTSKLVKFLTRKDTTLVSRDVFSDRKVLNYLKKNIYIYIYYHQIIVKRPLRIE